ncbi:hypothetical protein shn_01150 [Shinella sp. HZN7]|nr:hypothetical protein shn_01150 [Shinella sp. HZN7]
MSRKTKSDVPFFARITAGVLAAVPRIRPAVKVARRPRAVVAVRALVVLGDQLELDAVERAGAVERTGEDVEPVRAGIGGEADIRDDEPLRRLGIPFVRAAVRGGGGQDVDAGLRSGSASSTGKLVTTSLLRSRAISI